jgi:ketosteroid isomerase-like protein
MSGGRAQLEWAPIAGDVAGSGDLGFTVGVARRTSETGERSFSKYLSVWSRQPGGAWRFVADAGTSRPTPDS